MLYLRSGVALMLAIAAPAAAENYRELRIGDWGLSAGFHQLHSIEDWEFGIPRAEILAHVVAIRGPATRPDDSAECAGGPMQFSHFGTLTLNFRDGRWVGWSLSGTEADAPIRNEWGVGLASPREEVNALAMDGDVVTMVQRGNEAEFTVGRMHGTLSDATPDAIIKTLWAGAICNPPPALGATTAP